MNLIRQLASMLLLNLVVSGVWMFAHTVTADDELSPEARLAACARKYAECKTYRDEGVVVTEFKTAVEFTARYPFRTAFERDGRFRWQVQHSIAPGGKPEHTCTVWSDDQKAYRSYWTLMPHEESFNEFTMAMAGPTGISSGAATAIVPLLEPKIEIQWRTTDVSNPKQTGKDQVDDVDCVVIDGDIPQGRITLWLDDANAIRKIRKVAELDPSEIAPRKEARRMEKFTTVTTITIKPVFDDEIDDEHFAPPLQKK